MDQNDNSMTVIYTSFQNVENCPECYQNFDMKFVETVLQVLYEMQIDFSCKLRTTSMFLLLVIASAIDTHRSCSIRVRIAFPSYPIYKQLQLLLTRVILLHHPHHQITSLWTCHSPYSALFLGHHASNRSSKCNQ